MSARDPEWLTHGRLHFGPTLVLLRMMPLDELRAFGSCSCPAGEHADWHREHRHLAARLCPFPAAFRQIAGRTKAKQRRKKYFYRMP